MYQYKFTIITVCYNAEKYIKETIESVLKQNFQDYEYIIKDGKSKDSTLTIIHSMVEENDRFHVVSDTDQGIYDAMNQAVSLAKGEYVIFLNAGDCLTDNCMLKNVNEFIQKKPVDVAYGNILQIGNNGERLRKYGQICSKKWYFLSGDCICHQAMFARTELLREKPFDTRYIVCADKEWQLYHISRKRKFSAMNFTVASILQEGFSADHVQDFERETLQILKRYSRSIVWIYKCVDWMKHNTLGRKILRKVESFFLISNKNQVK